MSAETPVPHIIVAGNVNVDLILGPQTPWPTPGTEAVVPHHDLRPGGAAGNTALALQALGAPSTLVASRGSGPLGDWLQAAFSGIPARWTRSERPTAISVGLTHPDGERTFFTHLGHLEDDGAGPVLGEIALAPAGSLLLLVGTFLSPELRRAQAGILAAAHAHGLRTALDPGWPPEGWTPAVRAEVAGWLPACDHLLVNAAEAQGLSGRTGDEAADWLRGQLPLTATLVIKRGPDGAVAWRETEHGQVSAPPVRVVDTIGAGDTFNAAYLWSVLQGRTLEACLERGVQAASAAVSSSPRRYGSPRQVQSSTAATMTPSNP
ncbi:carbohydrate kinase family protein [Deinococcus koreensis]|uniref:Carbohydrate kinase family protein n=1 Tax=Deinococcus koreensis TaxID=2054903 RepID=A0A2K3USZ1_9DEIO|nr:carbohydrate kinase family protein [Deinococcus koreensis]PNY79647.1 carbohydrate kinase family protein [Deinococcus koreensis]